MLQTIIKYLQYYYILNIHCIMKSPLRIRNLFLYNIVKHYAWILFWRGKRNENTETTFNWNRDGNQVTESSWIERQNMGRKQW